ncbi:MAG TPA: SGNH/GDSL hydrolase family protein [bacterium]|nr:SGNH/GDSL hydrolase family protein [bacterium]
MTRASRTKKIIFAAVVAVAVLGGAETVLRLHEFNFYFNFGADILGMPLLEMKGIRRVMNRTVEFDPVLFWRFKPNQVLDAHGIYRKPVHINGHGFRGPEFTDGKPAGVYRVACIGDSTTFGWSVGDDETFAAQLQGLLAKQCGAGKVEVLNLGVTGYTSFQGRELMDLYVRKWRPDLVIFGFGPNDRLPALKSDQEHMRDRTWDVKPLTLFLSRFQLYKLIKAGVVYLENRARGLSLDPKTYIPRLKRKVSMEEFADNVHTVKRECDAIGAGLILINVDFPSLPTDDVSRAIKEVADRSGARLTADWKQWDAADVHEALARELHVPEIDLRQIFSDGLASIEAGRMDPARAAAVKKAMPDEIAKEPWRYLMIDNGHPNDWGHELIAQKLDEIIAELPAFRKHCGESAP